MFCGNYNSPTGYYSKKATPRKMERLFSFDNLSPSVQNSLNEIKTKRLLQYATSSVMLIQQLHRLLQYQVLASR